MKIDAGITFLPTDDLEATTFFYETICRLPRVIDQDGCRIFEVCPGSYVGFCGHTGPVPEPPKAVIVTFVTNDVDGWFLHLTKHEVETDGEPRHNEKYGIYHFFAFDPMGYRVEVQRFLDADWSVPL